MSDDWQAKYFGLAPRRPAQPRSFAMTDWQEQQARAERQHAERDAAEQRAVREKHERDRAERERDDIRALIAQFGVETVETILKHADPTFTLPPDVRPKPATPRKRKGV